MTYDLAIWIHERGTIALRCLCGMISPEWLHDELTFQAQMMQDYADAEMARAMEQNKVFSDAN